MKEPSGEIGMVAIKSESVADFPRNTHLAPATAADAADCGLGNPIFLADQPYPQDTRSHANCQNF